jgi:restriction endonuclease S subunit
MIKEVLKEYKIAFEKNTNTKNRKKKKSYKKLSDLKNIKIPFPPMDIQEKIVKECETVDKEVESAKKENDKLKQEIENYFQEIYKKSDTTYKLNDENLFDVFIGKRVLAKDISQNSSDGIRVYSANVYEPFGYTKKEFLKDFSLDSVLWGIDGDWMVNHLKKDIPFYPTDHCGVIRVKQKNIIEPKYLAWVLREVGKEQRFSRNNRVSTARIKALSIKAPKDYEIQKQIVSKIEEIEKQIEKNGKIIEDSKEKKENVLRKYL